MFSGEMTKTKSGGSGVYRMDLVQASKLQGISPDGPLYAFQVPSACCLQVRKTFRLSKDGLPGNVSIHEQPQTT